MNTDDEQPQAQLHAQPAVMRATIHITRKATGKVETYELVGTVPPEKEKEQDK